jgi:hypothetical protein
VIEVRIRRFVKDISQPANPQSTAAALPPSLATQMAVQQLPQFAPVMAGRCAGDRATGASPRTHQHRAGGSAAGGACGASRTGPYRLDRTGAIMLPKCRRYRCSG